MTALDAREQDWLQRALTDEEFQVTLRLPGDLTRSLYSEICLYGPQANQILLAVELFAEATDTHFDFQQRLLLRNGANHVFGIFVSSMNNNPFMVNYLSRLSKLSEMHDAYNRLVLLGALCCLVGEGVFEEQSVLEGFREKGSNMVTEALKAAQLNRSTLTEA